MRNVYRHQLADSLQSFSRRRFGGQAAVMKNRTLVEMRILPVSVIIKTVPRTFEFVARFEAPSGSRSDGRLPARLGKVEGITPLRLNLLRHVTSLPVSVQSSFFALCTGLQSNKRLKGICNRHSTKGNYLKTSHQLYSNEWAESTVCFLLLSVLHFVLPEWWCGPPMHSWRDDYFGILPHVPVSTIVCFGLTTRSYGNFLSHHAPPAVIAGALV